jgi:hypothetical protein
LCDLAGEPAEVTPLGQASNPVTKAKETVGRITTPWEAVVTEASEKEWKLKMGNRTTGSDTKIRLSVACPMQALTAEFTGELVPMVEAGTIIGASPAKLQFLKTTSGELESAIGANARGGPSGTVEGKLKLMGYEAAENLSVVKQ